AVVERLAPAGRDARSNDSQPRTARLAGLPKLIHVRLELGHARRVGDEKRISLGAHVLPRLELHAIGPELREVAAHDDAVALVEPLLRDRARRDRRRRQSRRGAPAAARIADPVLAQVRVVRVPGPERARDLLVVLRALVLVADEERDRRARGLPLVHAGEDLHLVLLAPLRHVPRGAGLAPVEVGLDVFFLQLHAGRAPVDHAPDRGPVRFAERRDGEERAEGGAGHGDASLLHPTFGLKNKGLRRRLTPQIATLEKPTGSRPEPGCAYTHFGIMGTSPNLKPLVWVASSKADLMRLPPRVIRKFA